MIYLNKNRNISSTEWSQIIKHLHLFDKLNNAKTVMIKPNLASGTRVDPKSHVISDFRLLRSLIIYIYSINPECIIYISESDSTGSGFAYLKFINLNLPEVLDLSKKINNQIKLLDLSRDNMILFTDEKFKFFNNEAKQLWLSNKLVNSDFKVSLSNLKTHSITGFTGACKNLFGCLPTTDKSVFHPSLSKVIHDVTYAIMPDLNIVDSFYGMDQDGPIHGKAIDSGYRVFSNNPVEADIYSCHTVGIKPKHIKHIKFLAKSFKYEYKQNNKDVFIKKYRKPKIFLRIMNNIGISLQRFGQIIYNFGHKIHGVSSFGMLIIVLTRPILIRIFGLEKLKKLKKQVIK